MPKKFHKELKEDVFKVTIFGSARIKRGTLLYKEIKNLAKMLGERGFDVVSGGGPGLMEAASIGHVEGSKKTGAHSIGVGIKLKTQRFNKSLDIKKEFSKFSERLDNFMALSNVVVVAPGGIGTLLELFYTWQLSQVKHIQNTPIILVGEQWPPFIKWLEKYPLKSGFFERKDLNLLFLADDCKEVIKMIDKIYEKYKEGDEEFYSNYKKYKIE